MQLRKVLKDSAFVLELELLRLLPLFWVIRWLRFVGGFSSFRKRRRLQKRVSTFWADFSEGSIAGVTREIARASFMRSRLEFLLCRHDPARFEAYIDCEGWEKIETALAKGRGAVLVAAHVGMPTILRWYFDAKGLAVCYLVRLGFPRKTGLEQWFVDYLWARHGVDAEGVIGDEPLHAQSLKKALTHLRNNGLVFIAPDGELGVQRLRLGVGAKETCGAGGFVLAELAGAEILPCFAHLDSSARRFKMQIQEPLPRLTGSDSRAEILQASATAYAKRIEDYLMRYPTQARRTFLPKR